MTAIDKLKSLLSKDALDGKQSNDGYPMRAKPSQTGDASTKHIPKKNSFDTTELSSTRDQQSTGARFHDQGAKINRNVLGTVTSLKAIDKLKALLAKEGETNSGEKSHIEDKERQEKETKTPENLIPWSRLKREFDDETHEDPY